MSNLFQKGLEYIHNKFNNNSSKMLIYTGAAGWILSSAAQIGALIINPKISKEQKSYLVPQEGLDAVINIGSFILVTLFVKNLLSSMVSTGKFVPKSVRNYLNKNKELYANSVGKLSFNLKNVVKSDPKFPQESYYAYKNYVETVGTIGAGIFSCNIVTPLLRNYAASKVQKRYIDNNYSKPLPKGNMKI